VEGSCEHGDEPSGSLKLLGISWGAAQSTASQEGLSSVSKVKMKNQRLKCLKKIVWLPALRMPWTISVSVKEKCSGRERHHMQWQLINLYSSSQRNRPHSSFDQDLPKENYRLHKGAEPFLRSRELCTQELPSILWNPKVHHLVHKSPPMVPTLSQIDPVHTIPSYLSNNKIYFNIVHPPTSWSS
jgi:hypothetical protein